MDGNEGGIDKTRGALLRPIENKQHIITEYRSFILDYFPFFSHTV